MKENSFGNYVTMDEQTRLKLLEGHVDVLTPAAEEQSKRLASVRCPNCGVRPCQPFIDCARPFVSGEVPPRKLLNCTNCSVTFDPDSLIQLNLGRLPTDSEKMASMFINVKRSKE